MAVVTSTPSFWKKTLSPGDAPLVVTAGELRFSLRVDDGDWFFGLCRDRGERMPSIETGVTEFPEKTTWQRLGSVGDLPKIHLAPTYPDRAVVVRPEVPFSVLPGERVQFYVGVPVSIRLVSPNDFPLLQVPVQTLSNTWFGLPTDGELAYAIRTRARRDVTTFSINPLRVICPVRVKNQSKELLNFERICIRPQFLSLYEDALLGLWANESSMIVRSAKEASRVAYSRSAPANLKRPHLWQKGSEEATGTHLLRAFSAGKGFFHE